MATSTPARPEAKPDGMSGSQPLLEVKGLRTQFRTQDGTVKAVDDVSFYVMPGETLCIVGESGSGKSITGLSIMRLIPQPPGKIASGEVIFNGRDVLKLSDEEVRKIRGNEIAMIFQDPMTSLNPVLTINRQISESLILHMDMNKNQARDRAIELLKMVGIPNPEDRINQYPHQFSGGMRQRVMIAMALSCNPKLLIADEPTTALDVTIQAQILDLMRTLQNETGSGVILITHSMGVVAGMADRVQVQYAGHIVETGTTEEIFAIPATLHHRSDEVDAPASTRPARNGSSPSGACRLISSTSRTCAVRPALPVRAREVRAAESPAHPDRRHGTQECLLVLGRSQQGQGGRRARPRPEGRLDHGRCTDDARPGHPGHRQEAGRYAP